MDKVSGLEAINPRKQGVPEMAILTIRDIAKKAKLKPTIVRSRLRRKKLSHTKGARWAIKENQVPRVMRLLQE